MVKLYCPEKSRIICFSKAKGCNILKNNYHTHSYHCRHASGKPEDYVIKAIESGYSTLGFSDHVPCPFSNGHRSSFRMDTEETETYINEIKEMQSKYGDRIRILAGYESEYYPKEEEGKIKLYEKYGCDYLILGQHFINNEYDGIYSGSSETDEDAFRTYINQIIEAIKTGRFSYICHPDIIRFTGDNKIYIKEISRLCYEAGCMDIPLELNFLGLATNRFYPRKLFWETAGKMGSKYILGCDAHEPSAIGAKDTEEKAYAFLAEAGITYGPVEELVLRKPY